jgi:hypothetical protein
MKVLHFRNHETYLIAAHALTKFLAGDRSTDTAQYAPSHLAWLVAQKFVQVGEDHHVMNRRLVTWQKIELAALALGAKWATVGASWHGPGMLVVALAQLPGEAFIITGRAGRRSRAGLPGNPGASPTAVSPGKGK